MRKGEDSIADELRIWGIGAPAAYRGGNIEADTALRRELERIRQQVLQHLLQTLRIGDDTAPEIGIDVDVERQLAIFRFVTERASNCIQQIGREDFLRIHRHGSGFNLGQVENVTDQIEQVSARTVDRSREFDLLG